MSPLSGAVLQRVASTSCCIVLVSFPALLAGCSTGRIYAPASPRSVEEMGVRVEPHRIVVVEVNDGRRTSVAARVTSASSTRLVSARVAARDAAPCASGVEPARVAAWGVAPGRWWGDKLTLLAPEQDLPTGTAWVAVGFDDPPAQFGPGGPAHLDVSLARDGESACVRAPLAEGGAWDEAYRLVLGAGTGAYAYRGAGVRSGGVALGMVRWGVLAGPLRVSFELRQAGGDVMGLSVETALWQRRNLGLLGSVAYEQTDGSLGGPRLGFRIAKLPARTEWSAFRDARVPFGWGIDLWVSRWWSSGEGDRWAFWAGVSAEFPVSWRDGGDVWP